MTHRRPLNGLRQDRVRGKAQRPNVTGKVRHSQRALKVSEAFEQPRPVCPIPYLAVLVRSEAGRDEVLGLPRVADGRDHTIAGSGQHAGAFHNLGQDGVEVEACADAQVGRCSVWRRGPAAPRSPASVRRDSSIPHPPQTPERDSAPGRQARSQQISRDRDPPSSTGTNASILAKEFMIITLEWPNYSHY